MTKDEAAARRAWVDTLDPDRPLTPPEMIERLRQQRIGSDYPEPVTGG